MRLADVLAQIPGLEKRFVYYLEAQGHIRPRKIQKARIARRDYGEADVRLLRTVWRYNQRGIAVQRAVELATQPPAASYAFCLVVPRREAEALRLARTFEQVTEVAALYGERANLVLKVLAPEEGDLHAVLDRLFEARVIQSAPTVLRAALDDAVRGVAAAHKKGASQPMRAWVLIKVPAKQIGGLVDELRSFSGIVEATAVYGETDVIAKVEVSDQAALDDLVMQRIQTMPNVESTRTFIAVGGMHWERESEVRGPKSEA